MVRHVLLVEDNEGDAYLIRDVLSRARCSDHVTAVTDGAKAIAFLRESAGSGHCPNLILLDLNLPRKDGRAVLAEIKAMPRLQNIPVVVFTTSQAASDMASCYRLGANSYVQKPGSLADFVKVVQAISRFWLGMAKLPGECELPHRSTAV